MADSASKRSSEWRERQKKKKFKEIKIWLSPSGKQRLDELKSHFGGTIADIFDRALKSLEAEMRSGVKKRSE
jgi:hypothetical protein